MDKGNTQTLASCWSVNGNIEILWPGHKSGNTPHLLLTLPIDLRSYQQRPETAAPLRHAGGAPVSSLIVQGLVHHCWELSELLWMVSKVIPVQPPMTPLSLLSQARVPRLQNNKTIAKCSQLQACGNVIGINHHLFLENWTLDLGLNTLVPGMPLMNRCCLIALTYEGRVSGLGVWNSCSFQLIFNYPSSHEGGYRRGRRVGVQTMRLATRHAIRAEVKLIKNRKWPAIIVGIIPHYTDGQCSNWICLSGVTISRTLEMIEASSWEGRVSIVANTVCPVTEWTTA